METTTKSWKWSASFGTAPVGAEVPSWDWNEDEDGYKSRYEFTYIPSDAVMVILDDVSGTGGIGTLLNILDETDDAEEVAIVTVQYGTSFIALGWMRFAEAAEAVRGFFKV